MNTLCLMTLIACLTGFSGCQLPSFKSEPLKEPPLITSAPAASSPTGLKEETHATHFADTEAIQNFSPALARAVGRALRLDVLRPPTSEAAFEPERIITYGEFRQWANDYQQALSGHKPSSPEPAPASSHSTPDPTDDYADNPTFLPSEMLWGSSGVRESNPLTRESLCALGVFLNRQDSAARQLSQAKIAQSQPGQTVFAENPLQTDPSEAQEGALYQLSDYVKISPWAQRYVALAYQNNWLEPVFNLSMAQITTAEGLHPAQPVSRGEAMLLLDLLYGQRPPNASSTIPMGTTGLTSDTTRGTTSLAPAGEAIQTPSKPNSKSQPLPLGKMQTGSKKGPQAPLDVLRADGPE